MPEPAPDTIYLQWNPDIWGDVPWCADKIEDDDIEYIRADVQQGIIADLLAVCKLIVAGYDCHEPGECGENCEYAGECHALAAYAATAKVEAAP